MGFPRPEGALRDGACRTRFQAKKVRSRKPGMAQGCPACGGGAKFSLVPNLPRLIGNALVFESTIREPWAAEERLIDSERHCCNRRFTKQRFGDIGITNREIGNETPWAFALHAR